MECQINASGTQLIEGLWRNFNDDHGSFTATRVDCTSSSSFHSSHASARAPQDNHNSGDGDTKDDAYQHSSSSAVSSSVSSNLPEFSKPGVLPVLANKRVLVKEKGYQEHECWIEGVIVELCPEPNGCVNAKVKAPLHTTRRPRTVPWPLDPRKFFVVPEKEPPISTPRVGSRILAPYSDQTVLPGKWAWFPGTVTGIIPAKGTTRTQTVTLKVHFDDGQDEKFRYPSSKLSSLGPWCAGLDGSLLDEMEGCAELPLILLPSAHSELREEGPELKKAASKARQKQRKKLKQQQHHQRDHQQEKNNDDEPAAAKGGAEMDKEGKINKQQNQDHDGVQTSASVEVATEENAHDWNGIGSRSAPVFAPVPPSQTHKRTATGLVDLSSENSEPTEILTASPEPVHAMDDEEEEKDKNPKDSITDRKDDVSFEAIPHDSNHTTKDNNSTNSDGNDEANAQEEKHCPRHNGIDLIDIVTDSDDDHGCDVSADPPALTSRLTTPDARPSKEDNRDLSCQNGPSLDVPVKASMKKRKLFEPHTQERTKKRAETDSAAEKKTQKKSRPITDGARCQFEKPRPYQVVWNGGAMVRQRLALDSPAVSVVKRDSIVLIAEIIGRRARIVNPVKGWLSMWPKKEQGKPIISPIKVGQPELTPPPEASTPIGRQQLFKSTKQHGEEKAENTVTEGVEVDRKEGSTQKDIDIEVHKAKENNNLRGNIDCGDAASTDGSVDLEPYLTGTRHEKERLDEEKCKEGRVGGGGDGEELEEESSEPKRPRAEFSSGRIMEEDDHGSTNASGVSLRHREIEIVDLTLDD
uniref:Uncharacterized protein n=1 Tax=Lotharella globosa TaxID=91324 RepID=A0A7S3YVY1_9EUKA